jgi:hypothetical protein
MSKRCVVIIVGNVRRITEEGARSYARIRQGAASAAAVRHSPGIAECEIIHAPRVPIRPAGRIGPDIWDRNKKASHHAAHHYHGRRRSHG